MKRTVATALLSACLLTLSACSGVNPPSINTQPGNPQLPQPQNPQPPVFKNPACAMAYPSVDLTPCVEPDGTPVPINPVETAIVDFTNELRVKGTLDGKTTDAAGVSIYDNVCKQALEARDKPGGIPRLPLEAHLHYAALKHSEYLAHHEIPSGQGLTHTEDPDKALYYQATLNARVHKAGALTDSKPASMSENVMSARMSTNTRETALVFVLAALKSEGHCRNMMNHRAGYIGIGYTKNSNNHVAITANFVHLN